MISSPESAYNGREVPNDARHLVFGSLRALSDLRSVDRLHPRTAVPVSALGRAGCGLHPDRPSRLQGIRRPDSVRYNRIMASQGPGIARDRLALKATIPPGRPK